MAILNYTTKIDSVKTAGEIMQILSKNNVSNVSIAFDGQIASAITFTIFINGGSVDYRLPANHAGVLKAMEAQKVTKGLLNKEQAVRVAWRIVKDWIEAQMALVEAQVADVAEVFLPYAVMKNGETLYNAIKNNPKLLS